MDEPREGQEPQVPLGDVLADIPLFREIQRVLLSGAGPVNWELARQVGIAVASWGKEDPLPSEEDRRAFEDMARAAELAVAEFTGLDAPAQVAAVTVHRRASWVEANVSSLRPLVDPVASKLARLLSDVRGEGPPEAIGLGALVDRMAPLLLGAQVGTVLGYLGQRVLGQYDVAVPTDAGTIAFVVPNIAEFEREWSLPPAELKEFVALHEVTHRFEFSRPWVREHFQGMIRDFTERTEFDLAALEERLAGLDLSDPERLQEAFGNPSDLVDRVLDDEGRLLLGRLQAFMSAAEGYGDHVMHAIGERMLPSHGQIDEALRRRREGASGETRLLERLLGIEMKLDQYRLGRTFCDAVAERAGEEILARMWSDPEAMPSLPELEEPTLWLARTAA
ncbi:MAG TPA: zinc-dependent metalloprotease [Actinomycetota bacterium]|nr:zinc-dependent metalloprotease [Actinomycetota bacterium]